MSATTTILSRIQNAKEYINLHFDSSYKGNYTHFYFGRLTPWDNEYSPDKSTSAFSELIGSKLQRIYMKLMTTDNVSLGIRRFNWKKWTVYTRADYNVEYTDYRNWIHPEQPFYVMNSEGNVYKCISNNYDSPSTEEPIGQSVNYIYLGDGYIWKFMFDLNSDIEDKFLTDTWIPVPHEDEKKSFAHLNVEANSIIGDIPYIHVINGGINYTYPPTIQIRGDGEDAEATSVLGGEVVDHIIINNPGSNYTVAEVKTFGNGSGIELFPMISPPGGHGSDAVMELGAFYVLMTAEIIGDDDGFAPITGSYRNTGLIVNTLDKHGNIITDEKTNTISVINITDSSGKFMTNELVIGEKSHAQGRVYFDPSGTDKDIQMFMIYGNFINGERIHGQETGEVGIFNSSTSTITDIDIWSGNIIYKENIIFITRREIQIEKFVFTVEF
jgi:hypothetical protein